MKIISIFVRYMTHPTLEEICKLTGCKIEGDTAQQIKGVSGLEEAHAGYLSFLSNPKYAIKLSASQASYVIVSDKIESSSLPTGKVYLQHANPYLAFCRVLDAFYNPFAYQQGIESGAFVHAEASVANTCYVAAFSYISKGAILSDKVQVYPQVFIGKNVKIGSGTVLYAGVKIYDNTEIGENCILHSGAVIGSDGFGHAPMGDGSYAKIPQIGHVVIGNNVEIGANCTIDRATLGKTVIEEGVKLDNLIQIAHNVKIGSHTVIASQTGVSGSTSIGKYCMIGGQVGFAGHIQIADNTRFGAQSGIPASIKEPNTDWMGTPVVPLRENLKAMVLQKKLPELAQRIQALEAKLK